LFDPIQKAVNIECPFLTTTKSVSMPACSAKSSVCGPVADRMLLPTADAGRCVTDALTETYHIVNIARAATATFPGEEAMEVKGGYSLLASPTLYPGQTLRAAVSSPAQDAQVVTCRLYIRVYDHEGKLKHIFGPGSFLEPASTQELSWTLDGSALDIHGFRLLKSAWKSALRSAPTAPRTSII
jgi:hypothetical protein